MQELNALRRGYEQKIAQKKSGFELMAKMIGYTIQEMGKAGLLENEVEVWGRLKSFKSAYENYHKKAIDDCFGIRIIAKNDKDLEKIQQQLDKIFIVEKTKDHGKKSNTKYNAVHQMIRMNEHYADTHKLNIEGMPIIEIQFWNNELENMCETGEISYSKLKHKDLKKIQTVYKQNPFEVYRNLPTYYEIRGNKIRMLSAEETLRKIYPDLVCEEHSDIEISM